MIADATSMARGHRRNGRGHVVMVGALWLSACGAPSDTAPPSDNLRGPSGMQTSTVQTEDVQTEDVQTEDVQTEDVQTARSTAPTSVLLTTTGAPMRTLPEGCQPESIPTTTEWSQASEYPDFIEWEGRFYVAMSGNDGLFTVDELGEPLAVVCLELSDGGIAEPRPPVSGGAIAAYVSDGAQLRAVPNLDPVAVVAAIDGATVRLFELDGSQPGADALTTPFDGPIVEISIWADRDPIRTISDPAIIAALIADLRQGHGAAPEPAGDVDDWVGLTLTRADGIVLGRQFSPSISTIWPTDLVGDGWARALAEAPRSGIDEPPLIVGTPRAHVDSVWRRWSVPAAMARPAHCAAVSIADRFGVALDAALIRTEVTDIDGWVAVALARCGAYLAGIDTDAGRVGALRSMLRILLGDEGVTPTDEQLDCLVAGIEERFGAGAFFRMVAVGRPTEAQTTKFSAVVGECGLDPALVTG